MDVNGDVVGGGGDHIEFGDCSGTACEIESTSGGGGFNDKDSGDSSGTGIRCDEGTN